MNFNINPSNINTNIICKLCDFHWDWVKKNNQSEWFYLGSERKCWGRGSPRSGCAGRAADVSGNGSAPQTWLWAPPFHCWCRAASADRRARNCRPDERPATAAASRAAWSAACRWAAPRTECPGRCRRRLGSDCSTWGRCLESCPAWSRFRASTESTALPRTLWPPTLRPPLPERRPPTTSPTGSAFCSQASAAVRRKSHRLRWVRGWKLVHCRITWNQ